ncbi:leucine-rich repeat domain-containing protein [Parasedimentitalea maritima]|uniref:Leucine-rich repeat domain-containing protein n=1 Tax=Parasedimentitalea maritima TaxID=2578117 RepID=A0ABY2UXW3_9RHOB|nr:leucine-rich repeat domain-containing protein [Zongyanglinia marina]TLP65835.1 leucine-rich repeat domain-containing protein [Zongyanglinia marina]
MLQKFCQVIWSGLLSFGLVSTATAQSQAEMAAYQMAEQKIAENAASGYPKLELWDVKDLQYLPPSLANSKHLREIVLGSQYCTPGRISCDREGPALNDISVLAQLPNLKVLGLGSVAVLDKDLIASLTGLRVLSLANTSVKDLSFLSEMTQLQELNLRFNPVSDLSPPAGLTGLSKLGLNNTQVSDISPLSEMKG